MDTEPTSQTRRWTRRSTDRWIAGVAGGIADAAGAPVWVVRAGFVLATVLGSAGLWIYLLLWCTMPRRDHPASPAQRLAGRFPQAPVWLGLALLVLGVIWFAAQMGWLNPALLGALVLIGIGVLLFVRDGEAAGRPLPPPSARPDAETYRHPAPAEEAALPPASLPPRPPRPRRAPSFLGPLTLGVGLLIVAFGALLDLAGVVTFDLADASALLLLVLGAGMAAGTVIGRARWLIFPIILLVPIALVTSVLHIDLHDGIGQRDVMIRTAGTVVERLGVGEMTIDLTQLPKGVSVDVTADLGIGMLTLNVPDDAIVVLDGQVGLGVTQAIYGRIVGSHSVIACCLEHEPTGGFSVPLRWEPRNDAIPGGGTIRIHASVSIGEIRINHVHRGAAA